jgi:ribonuclease HI
MDELTLDTWRAHCDGGALPHRGAMGIGVVLIAPDGQRHTISRLVQAHGGGTEAEAHALIATLERAKELGVRALHVHCDSTVVIDHTFDGTPTTARPLADLFARARALFASFDALSIEWVPRRRNAEADALARAALGLPTRPPPPPMTTRERRRARR